MPVFLDIETFAEEPIKNGTYKYAESAELLLCAWAVDDGPVHLWDTFNERDIPEELEDILLGDEICVAHNSAFEASVLAKTLKGVEIDPKRWRCTMAQAYAHGLPGALENLGIVLGLPQDKKKSKEGYDLIRLFCIPPAKNSKRGRATHLTHPAEWEKFKNYCIQDVVAHREVYKRLPQWNYKGSELDLWHLDQEINARGLGIDIELAQSAVSAVNKAQTLLKERTEDLTFGDVSSATQRDQMLRHILAAYGVELPDMQAATLERRMDDPDLPSALKELLGIRLMATTSSTAKYKKVLSCVSSDNRLRGTLQFCGASRTGRDGGRLLNPQNLPRPTMKHEDIDIGIDALKKDCADILFDNVMEVSSNALRGLIVAEKEKKLLIADLANIEGRYLAWLAGETWKLKAFRDYDTILGTDDKGDPIRKGHDLYKLAYARSFGIPPTEVTKQQRNEVGKTLELSMGFMGGVSAFVTFATAFNTDLDDMAEKAWQEVCPPGSDNRLEAHRVWEWAVEEKRTLGLKQKTYMVCNEFKLRWRKSHPMTASFWKDVEHAVRAAIETPNTDFTVRKIKARRTGNWLRILMPSGRCLCYPHPQVDNKGKISFMGTDQYTRKWSRISTFGGKLVENLTQAGARDIFMAGVTNTASAGYDIVTRVHDEVVCEVPDTNEFTIERLCELMTTNIPWSEGLPLAAAGFSSYRYRKGD